MKKGSTVPKNKVLRCGVCGRKTKAASTLAKYCGSRCRVLAWAQRQGQFKDLQKSKN